MGTAECGARAGWRVCAALALVRQGRENFAAKAKKEPQADTRLGFYRVASVQGFWSDGVGVSGMGRCRPADLMALDREAAALTQCPVLSQFT